MNSCPLVLGTAQLGLPYGIANKTGQPSQSIANDIIQTAWENGINEFDTAQGYGNSEHVLGKALSELGINNKALVISKFDPGLNHLNSELLSNALDESLERLRIPFLFGIMLHREEMLTLWKKGLGNTLRGFVSEGRVKYIGVSVYSPDKAIHALNTDGVDMVQLPANILDRKPETASVVQLAKEKNKKIYVRSVFLQGLILMDINEIPEKMSFARPVIEKLESLSRELEISRQELALGYIKSEMPEAKVIFGADTPGHVKDNLLRWDKELPSSFVPEVKKLFENVDEKILNPALWPN